MSGLNSIQLISQFMDFNYYERVSYFSKFCIQSLKFRLKFYLTEHFDFSRNISRRNLMYGITLSTTNPLHRLINSGVLLWHRRRPSAEWEPGKLLTFHAADPHKSQSRRFFPIHLLLHPSSVKDNFRSIEYLHRSIYYYYCTPLT